MKAAFLTLILLATTVAGQVLRPIDPRRTVDANGKTVDMPVLNFDTVAKPTRAEPVSPLTGQYLQPGKSLEQKRVDTTTLQFSTVPTHVLPQQNFAPKRAVVAGTLAAPARVPTDRATIVNRVIRPNTSKGAEELKQQLNEPH